MKLLNTPCRTSQFILMSGGMPMDFSIEGEQIASKLANYWLEKYQKAPDISNA